MPQATNHSNNQGITTAWQRKREGTIPLHGRRSQKWLLIWSDSCPIPKWGFPPTRGSVYKHLPSWRGASSCPPVFPPDMATTAHQESISPRPPILQMEELLRSEKEGNSSKVNRTVGSRDAVSCLPARWLSRAAGWLSPMNSQHPSSIISSPGLCPLGKRYKHSPRGISQETY